MENKKTARNVTSTNAGDDGEAVKRSEETVLPTAAGNNDVSHWYVAVVRVNCEKKIKLSIEDYFKQRGNDLETWVPVKKRVVVNSRGKRNLREYIVLATLIFVKVAAKHLNDIRFRSDVYKMLSMPGTTTPYIIPDTVLCNFRKIVEHNDAVVLNRPLKKGDKVRIIAGELIGCIAYVQRIQGKKAIIGNEIQYIGGATIEISKDSLEYIKE